MPFTKEELKERRERLRNIKRRHKMFNIYEKTLMQAGMLVAEYAPLQDGEPDHLRMAMDVVREKMGAVMAEYRNLQLTKNGKWLP